MRKYFIVVRPRGVIDCVVCYTSEIGCLLDIMQAHVIGEGYTKLEAINSMGK